MATYDRSVFINCPFDADYHPLFRPLIFTTLYLGLQPRIAFERSDGGELRLSKIHRLIRESRFGIHDLSRCRAERKGEYFRLNMPLELGIDCGCKWYGGRRFSRKRFLVLEKRRWGYQKALSDLAGADIKSHGNQPWKMIEAVRNWLVQEAQGRTRPASEIRTKFLAFRAAHSERLERDGYTKREIELLPLNELKLAMVSWLRAEWSAKQVRPGGLAAGNPVTRHSAFVTAARRGRRIRSRAGRSRGARRGTCRGC
ncbi:MAG: hypothetical protein JSR48_02790 [Verrucomicrobia bacterium]|nr:hypothetical protein [Verrucomicrobiota bacterium]